MPSSVVSCGEPGTPVLWRQNVRDPRVTNEEIQLRLAELLQATFPGTGSTKLSDWRHRDLAVEWFDLAFNTAEQYTTEHLKSFLGHWTLERSEALTASESTQLKQIVDYWDAWQFGTRRATMCGFLA